MLSNPPVSSSFSFGHSFPSFLTLFFRSQAPRDPIKNLIGFHHSFSGKTSPLSLSLSLSLLSASFFGRSAISFSPLSFPLLAGFLAFSLLIPSAVRSDRRLRSFLCHCNNLPAVEQPRFKTHAWYLPVGLLPLGESAVRFSASLSSPSSFLSHFNRSSHCSFLQLLLFSPVWRNSACLPASLPACSHACSFHLDY